MASSSPTSPEPTHKPEDESAVSASAHTPGRDESGTASARAADFMDEDASSELTPASTSTSSSTPATSSTSTESRRGRRRRRPYRMRATVAGPSTADGETGSDPEAPGTSRGRRAEDEGDDIVFEEAAEEEEEADGGFPRSKMRRTSSSTTSSDSSSSSSSSDSTDNDDIGGGDDDDDGDFFMHDSSLDGTDEDFPRPTVLSKTPHQNTFNITRDIIQRQVTPSLHRAHGRRHPRRRQFVRNRMGCLDLVSRLELSCTLEGHAGCVNALHFNESGNLLASGSDDQDIIIWDWEMRRARTRFPSGHRANVFQSKFLPLTGDTHLVSTSRDGQVRLADLGQGAGGAPSTKQLAQHRGAANKLGLLNQCPHTFLSGGEDAIIYSIDVRRAKPASKLLQQKNAKQRNVPIYTVGTNPVNDFHFCTAGKDEYVRIYDRRKISELNGAPVKKYCPHNLVGQGLDATVTCATFNHDGSEVLGSWNDEDIYLFNAEHSDGAEHIRRFQGHRNSQTVKGVNFYGPSSEFVVSGSDCGHVFLWSKETEAIVRMAKGDESGVVNVLEPHPNLPILATSGLDDDVKIWFPTCPGPDDDEQKEQSIRKERAEKIEKTVKRNCLARDRHRRLSSEPMDGQRIWAIWRQLNRSSNIRMRRRAAAAAAAIGGRDEDEDDQGDWSFSSADNIGANVRDGDTDGDTDEDEGAIQCPTS